MKEDRGSRKCIRDNSKKNVGVEEKKLDDTKASEQNMNILVGQATNLLKTL